MPNDWNIAFRLHWPVCPHLRVMPFKQFAPPLLLADVLSSLLSPVTLCLVANKTDELKNYLNWCFSIWICSPPCLPVWPHTAVEVLEVGVGMILAEWSRSATACETMTSVFLPYFTLKPHSNNSLTSYWHHVSCHSWAVFNNQSLNLYSESGRCCLMNSQKSRQFLLATEWLLC